VPLKAKRRLIAYDCAAEVFDKVRQLQGTADTTNATDPPYAANATYSADTTDAANSTISCHVRSALC